MRGWPPTNALARLLTAPRVCAHFDGPAPDGEALVAALYEFGAPQFSYDGRWHCCRLSLPNRDGGVVCFSGQDIDQQTAAGNCLLLVLAQTQDETQRGLSDLENFLAQREL